MIDLYIQNHELKSMRNSKYIFHCDRCNNIIKCEYIRNGVPTLIYYLDYDKGGFWPLKDCNEMIIKEVLE